MTSLLLMERLLILVLEDSRLVLEDSRLILEDSLLLLEDSLLLLEGDRRVLHLPMPTLTA